MKSDPINRILNKKAYSSDKKVKYLINLTLNATGRYPRLKVFDNFVKSG